MEAPIHSADDLLLFRGMQVAQDGYPSLGPTARTLGVRAEIDIAVDAAGVVMPEHGGMSVTPGDPGQLPRHRRPPEFDGTGKDPLWTVAVRALGPQLRYRPDPLTPTRHGFIEPAAAMPFAEFQAALAATRGDWRRAGSAGRSADLL